jgi:hypothetical protein
MKRFLHDTKNLGVFPAIDPHDAGGIEPKAREPCDVAIRMADGPQGNAAPKAKNGGGHRCGEGCYRGR